MIFSHFFIFLFSLLTKSILKHKSLLYISNFVLDVCIGSVITSYGCFVACGLFVDTFF